MKHLLRDTWNRLVPFVLLLFVFSPVRAQSLEQQGNSLPTTSLYQNLSIPAHLESSPQVDATGNSEPTHGKASIDAQWDPQFEYSTFDSLGYDGNAGAFWTGTEFWVSKWNSDTLATLDANGSLIQVFTIPGVTGVRSITSDGTNLFLGTANTSITEVNPATKTVVSTITITGAGAAIGSRFLTYDPTLDAGNGGFYIGNFTSAIAAVSMTGATLSTIPQTTHGRIGMYGAAYDGISPGAPSLWVFEQSGTPSNAIISQLQLPAGTWTGVSYDIDANLGLSGALAGGLFIATNLVTGQNTIGGLAQGAPDILFGLELDFQVINVDAQIANALPDPGLSFVPLAQAPSFSLTADINNFGVQALAAASLDVEVIDLETNTVTYTGSSASAGINSTQSASFSVGPWTPVDTGSYFVSMATNTGLQLDEVSANDSAAFVISVTDSTLGLDQGPAIVNLGVGVGAGQNAVLAIKLPLLVPDTLTSVTAFFGTPPSGQVVSCNIYSPLPNGEPSSSPIATTLPYTFTANDAANGIALTLPLAGGKIGLPAGDFFIGVVEVGQTIGLAATSGLYQPDNIWFRADNIGGGGWLSATNEAVLAIRANFANSPLTSSIVQMALPNLTVEEDTGIAVINVFIVNPDTIQSTSVEVSLLSASASLGIDFLWTDTTIIFPAGSSSPISLPIVILEDTIIEPIEYFSLQLSNATNGFGIGKDTIRVEIIDNDLLPEISFSNHSLSFFERFHQPTVSVNVTNTDGTPISVDVRVVGGTATNGLDYVWTDTTLVFTSNQVLDGVNLTFDYLDDPDDEPLESIIFVLENLTGIVNQGGIDTLRLFIIDDDSPFYDIASITADSNGDCVIDSIGVYCSITGIVTGNNLDSTQLAFTLADSIYGIKVVGTYPFTYYNPVEGDELWVQGIIMDSLGMAHIEVDSVFLLSSQNVLIPTPFTEIAENTENKLGTLECVRLLDSLSWPAPNQETFLQVTNNVDTFQLYIHPSTNVGDLSFPEGWLNVSGIGAQIDSFAPYKDGYYLVPRYKEDFVELIPSGSFQITGAELSEGNDSISFQIMLSGSMPDTVSFILFPDSSGSATPGVDFSLPSLNGTFGGCNVTDTVEVQLNLFGDNIPEGDENIVLILNFLAMTETDDNVISSDTLIITIIEANSITNISKVQGVDIYPNPGSDEVIISAEERILSVELLDMTGRVLAGKVPNTVEESFDTETLPSGVYFLRVETAKGIGTYRWIKR